MLNYATVGSNRLEEAKAFYDALLATIGMKPLFEHPSGGRLYGAFGKSAFGVLGAYDGGEASVGNGVTIGFGLDSPRRWPRSTPRRLSLAAPTRARRASAAAMRLPCPSPISAIWMATSCAATTSRASERLTARRCDVARV